MPVIDADCHVIETERTWAYIDESERHLRPILVRAKTGVGPDQEYWLVDGRYLQKHVTVVKEESVDVLTKTAQASRELSDVSARLAHMDELGVDVQVLYPTIFLLSPITNNVALDLAACHAYNLWLAQIWKQAPYRLRWAVVPPLLSMDKALEELNFGKANGACGVYLRPIEHDRRLVDPYFYPLYREASKLDMPVLIHSAAGSFSQMDLFADENGISLFKLPVAGIFHELVIKRVPELFPDLRWGFMESAASWVPWMVADAGRRFAKRGMSLSRTFCSEYRFYIECDLSDDLNYILGFTGEDHIVLGSDYGHHDTASEIDALRKMKTAGKLPGRVVDKILQENPARLYSL